MFEFLCAMLGGAIICRCAKIMKDISINLKNKNNLIEDDRDTEEKIIAGEDTSEIALNYLKKL